MQMRAPFDGAMKPLFPCHGTCEVFGEFGNPSDLFRSVGHGASACRTDALERCLRCCSRHDQKCGGDQRRSPDALSAMNHDRPASFKVILERLEKVKGRLAR